MNRSSLTSGDLQQRLDASGVVTQQFREDVVGVLVASWCAPVLHNAVSHPDWAADLAYGAEFRMLSLDNHAPGQSLLVGKCLRDRVHRPTGHTRGAEHIEPFLRRAQRQASIEHRT